MSDRESTQCRCPACGRHWKIDAHDDPPGWCPMCGWKEREEDDAECSATTEDGGVRHLRMKMRYNEGG